LPIPQQSGDKDRHDRSGKPSKDAAIRDRRGEPEKRKGGESGRRHGERERGATDYQGRSKHAKEKDPTHMGMKEKRDNSKSSSRKNALGEKRDKDEEPSTSTSPLLSVPLASLSTTLVSSDPSASRSAREKEVSPLELSGLKCCCSLGETPRS